MQKIRLMALGGLDENGRNMYLVEIDDAIFVLECGLKYPSESERLGIEYMIPDMSYLIENQDRVKGVFISHGHDDVMRGLIHLTRQFEFPIYATALTARVLDGEFRRNGITNRRINIISSNGEFKVGGVNIRSFSMMQSIPDCVGFAFETEYGYIVYTAEFILDSENTSKAFYTNVDSLVDLGKKGVFLLLAESVGANMSGYTAPRHRISEPLERSFENAKNRIILSVYRQNAFRTIEILKTAQLYHRHVFFINERHRELMRAIDELGYYKIPKGLILEPNEFKDDMEDTVVVISGSGEHIFKRGRRAAMGEDPRFSLRATDTFINASPVVPGTEKEASAMENDFFKAGLKSIKINPAQCLSLHASSEDLKMLLFMMRPKYYIPVKGEYAQLIANADIATSTGYTPDRILILDNGQIAVFENGKLISTREFIELNDVSIDSSSRNDVSSTVLKDREALSTDGVIVVGLVLDFKTKKLIGGPDVQSRGVIYLKDAEHILQEIARIIISTIETAVADGRYENMACRAEAKESISRYVFRETGKRPMILPAIVEINLGD